MDWGLKDVPIRHISVSWDRSTVPSDEEELAGKPVAYSYFVDNLESKGEMPPPAAPKDVIYCVRFER